MKKTIEQLEKENKELKEKNRCLVDIMMKIFYMDPIKRHIVIKSLKEIIGNMSQKDLDKLLKQEDEKDESS